MNQERIINIYWLNNKKFKIKFMLKYLSSYNYLMAYSETRIVVGGLARVPILNLIANFIKNKFGIKTEETKTFVKEEPVKIIEVKGKVVKEGKAKAIKEISNKLDIIERKADDVFEKVKKNKKDKKKKKKNN